MLSAAAQSHKKMWECIQAEVIETSATIYKEDLPEINLLSTVIIRAAEDRDERYFSSMQYIFHCRLLNIDPAYILLFIKKAWEIIDNKEVWQRPSLLADDYDFDEFK